MTTKHIENKGTFALPAILTAVWAIILLVVFFANRGSDVGQLGKLLGNQGGGPLIGTGVLDSIAGSVVALLIAISWFGVGSFASSFIKVSKSESHSHVLELAMNTAVGAAIWSLVWFFLGIVDAYNGVVAIAATVFGIVFAAMSFRRVKAAKDESRVPERTSGIDKILIVLIAIPVLLAFIASLAPPTAKDALLYHASLAKAFVTQGDNGFVEGNIASYLALGTEMHAVWARSLAGFISPRAAEAAGGAVVWAFFPLLLIAIFGWARELNITRRWSLIAVVMIASVPTVYHEAASSYIDVALSLFLMLAVYALCRWWRTLENGWLIFMAIFLGAALSAKLTALFAIAAIALVIMLRVRKAQSSEPDSLIKILVSGFAALILAGIIASPWYLRTWQATGNPVFPFYMSVLGGEAPGWDEERSHLIQAMTAQYGGIDKTSIDYFLTPWNLSVTAQPEVPAHFDGVLGVAFLFGLPLLIWALWKFELPVEIKIGAGVAAVVFLFWLFSSQQLRYLLPVLPLLVIGIVLAAEQISKAANGFRTITQGAMSIAAFTGVLVCTAWFFQKAPLRVVLGGETRDQYLSRNIDYYPYYQMWNADTPVDAKVWLINMRRDTYNLDRPYFSDYIFEDWTLRNMVWESRNVQELKAKTAAMGVQYVLTRHDVLFNYDRSALVDDQKPRAENEAKLKIAKEFILDKANTLRADERFSLIKVF